MHWSLIEAAIIAQTYLLAWKADVHMKDENGQTPLHIAVKEVPKLYGIVRQVRFLTLCGADRHAKDIDAKSPYDIAMSQEYKEDTHK